MSHPNGCRGCGRAADYVAVVGNGDVARIPHLNGCPNRDKTTAEALMTGSPMVRSFWVQVVTRHEVRARSESAALKAYADGKIERTIITEPEVDER